MAELHESLLVYFRRRFLRSGFQEVKSPMPTYRPDVFARRISRYGKILEEVLVEAEIESTLFSEHTSHQLVLMDEYISHQKKKRIKVRGYLLVPKGRHVLALSKSLISSLFPNKNFIKILQGP